MAENKQSGKSGSTARKSGTASKSSTVKSGSTAKKSSASSVSAASANKSTGSSGNSRPYKKPENGPLYNTVSFIVNTVLGVMGLGMGFCFFLVSALCEGNFKMSVILFLIAAVCITIYLWIAVKFNLWWVKKCSDKKLKRADARRMFLSMVYFVVVLVISFAYSFLKSALS